MKSIALVIGGSVVLALSAASLAQQKPADRKIITDIGDIQPADPENFYKEPGMDAGVPTTTQERAFTSPIWYTP